MKTSRRAFLSKSLLASTGAAAALLLSTKGAGAQQVIAKKPIETHARYKDSRHNRRYYQSAQF